MHMTVDPVDRFSLLYTSFFCYIWLCASKVNKTPSPKQEASGCVTWCRVFFSMQLHHHVLWNLHSHKKTDNSSLVDTKSKQHNEPGRKYLHLTGAWSHLSSHGLVNCQVHSPTNRQEDIRAWLWPGLGAALADQFGDSWSVVIQMFTCVGCVSQLNLRLMRSRR